MGSHLCIWGIQIKFGGQKKHLCMELPNLIQNNNIIISVRIRETIYEILKLQSDTKQFMFCTRISRISEIYCSNQPISARLHIAWPITN